MYSRLGALNKRAEDFCRHHGKYWGGSQNARWYFPPYARSIPSARKANPDPSSDDGPPFPSLSPRSSAHSVMFSGEVRLS